MELMAGGKPLAMYKLAWCHYDAVFKDHSPLTQQKERKSREQNNQLVGEAQVICHILYTLRTRRSGSYRWLGIHSFI